LEAPAVTEGDRLEVEDVAVEERFQERPPRYNQATLLEKMERENIGTKATRADVIGTLVERGYAVEANLVVTEPGLSVMEAMERHAPSIVTTELTRGMEQQLAAVEVEEAEGRDLLRGAVRTLAKQLKQLRAEEEEVGRDIERAFAASDASQVLGPCPVCRTGRLRVVRSRKTGKRFVGCTNYPGSCRASAPLPQKGRLKAEPRPCRHCSWPVIVASGGRRPWKLCVNPRCPSKGGGKDEVPAV
jgi:DNA topoisomerase-1